MSVFHITTENPDSVYIHRHDSRDSSPSKSQNKFGFRKLSGEGVGTLPMLGDCEQMELLSDPTTYGLTAAFNFQICVCC